MFDKRATSGKVDDAVARSVNFELTIADLARRSERHAWWVACGAIVIALILVGGYFYILPLKQKVPYLVMADAYTGTSTVARLAPSPGLQHITASEAINRSNVAHYVLARESYDVTLMNLRDWNVVMTMSTPGVSEAYRALYSPSNADNPYKVYGKDEAIRVKILSIVLMGAQGRTPTGATVRFQRSLYNKSDGSTRPLDNKIATIAFTYKPGLKMADQYRIDNPLGFQVTDYRVNNDYDATPPSVVPNTTANVSAGESPSVALPTPATPQPRAEGASQQPGALETSPLAASVPSSGATQPPASSGVGKQ